jgi:membrane-associated phospholipid phosphatase
MMFTGMKTKLKKPFFLTILIFGSIFCCTSMLARNHTLTAWGDTWQFILPTMAGITSVAYERNMLGLVPLASSYILAVGVSIILKNTIHEKRISNSNDRSFPSGHTTSAFAGAFFIQQRYGTLPALPFYAAAGLVSYSRIDAKAHYWHDVMAGASIAYLTNLLVTKRYIPPEVIVTPMMDGESKSIGLNVGMKIN